MTRAIVVLVLMAVGGLLLVPPLLVVMASAGPGEVELFGLDIAPSWPIFMAGSAAMLVLAALVSVRGLRR